ncbi:alpha/beta hydrolase-fold protein [Actinomycetaceae bacterium MB13-C1-2]|nr:alpha/beta hydrolase-fold protein [Actinomycetaceae bacterium MB13-C1-2]
MIRLEYVSESLKLQTRLTVAHPFDSSEGPRTVRGVLVLLHGMLDGCDTWLTQTRVAREAACRGVLVLMPDGQRSFWRDMVHGGDYQRMLSEELPKLAAEVFGVAHGRDSWMIAGNSMGGYGALHTALGTPGIYSAAGAFSPLTNPELVTSHVPGEYLIPGEMASVFPDDFNGSELRDMACDGDIPVDLTLACGRADFLYGSVVQIHNQMLEADRPHEYWVEDNAGHDWDFWDRCITRFLRSRF